MILLLSAVIEIGNETVEIRLGMECILWIAMSVFTPNGTSFSLPQMPPT